MCLTVKVGILHHECRRHIYRSPNSQRSEDQLTSRVGSQTGVECLGQPSDDLVSTGSNHGILTKAGTERIDLIHVQHITTRTARPKTLISLFFSSIELSAEH